MVKTTRKLGKASGSNVFFCSPAAFFSSQLQWRLEPDFQRCFGVEVEPHTRISDLIDMKETHIELCLGPTELHLGCNLSI